MFSEKKGGILHGILLIALFSCAAFYLSEIKFIKALSLSPMIIGIVLGMLYANSLRNHLPATWVPGIQFCSKKILRLGIILYGFRLTFQNVFNVGMPAIIVDALIVCITICGGVLLGKLLKMDRDISLLTSVGSGICGAAAILGAESAIKTQPYKTAVAVSTVVIFGTISMFLYPILYNSGIINMPAESMGIFTGSTIHEVAHTVGAGNAMGKEISDVAIIVKMIRVIMLVPVIFIIGYIYNKHSNNIENNADTQCNNKRKLAIPWFALWFLIVIGFNSLNIVPSSAASFINNFSTFLLTMAMTALGAETSIDKFKKAGAKPFLLALFLYIWLLVGGYFLAKYLVPVMI